MKQNSGFTLIELLISVVILSVVVMAVVTSISSSTNRNLVDQHERRARMVADSILESRTYAESNYASIVAGSSSFQTIVDSRGTGTADNLNGTATVTIVADSLTGTSSVKVVWREVRVSVRWTENDKNATNDTVTVARRVCQL